MSSYHPLGGPSTDAANAPVTRSRTLFYLSVRDSSTFGAPPHRRPPTSSAAQYGDIGDEDDERGGLLAGQSGSGGVQLGPGAGLPPKWVDISDEVEDILGRVATKVAGLDKLHAKHVLPGFTDRTAEEREIERQTNDITRDFRKCSTLITTIAPARGAPRVETVAAKNVQRGLAQKVQTASSQFRHKQKVYMQRLQGHAIKTKDLLAASGAITTRGRESYDLLGDEDDGSQLQLQSQTSNVPLNIDQRTTEIAQIATSITELSDLFRDLGNLVVAQGTVLDSVEYNVQQTAQEMEDAVEELVIAKQYQSNTGRRKCILLLVLIIVGLVIVLIYKPRRHGSEPPPPPESSTSPDSGNIPAASGISRPIPGQDNEPESEPDKATQPRPTDDPEDYRRSRVRRRVRP